MVRPIEIPEGDYYHEQEEQSAPVLAVHCRRLHRCRVNRTYSTKPLFERKDGFVSGRAENKRRIALEKTTEYAVSMRHITKTFGKVVANHDVSLDLRGKGRSSPCWERTAAVKRP